MLSELSKKEDACGLACRSAAEDYTILLSIEVQLRWSIDEILLSDKSLETKLQELAVLWRDTAGYYPNLMQRILSFSVRLSREPTLLNSITDSDVAKQIQEIEKVASRELTGLPSQFLLRRKMGATALRDLALELFCPKTAEQINANLKLMAKKKAELDARSSELNGAVSGLKAKELPVEMLQAMDQLLVIAKQSGSLDESIIHEIENKVTGEFAKIWAIGVVYFQRAKGCAIANSTT